MVVVELYLPLMDKSISQVTKILEKAEKILFITGAGLSADSGLPTYRGVGGLYDDKHTDDGIPIEVTREVKRQAPEVLVIALSMYDTEGYVIEVLRAGASGYVLKKSTAGDLVKAVRQVMAGNSYVSPSLDKYIIDAFMHRTSDTRSMDPYDMLTPRERQVMQMAAQGMSNPEIAERLMLSVRTVEMHRAHLLKKLNLNNQTELVRFALKNGFLE